MEKLSKPVSYLAELVRPGYLGPGRAALAAPLIANAQRFALLSHDFPPWLSVHWGKLIVSEAGRI